MIFQISLPWNGYTSYADGAAFHVAECLLSKSSLAGERVFGNATSLPLLLEKPKQLGGNRTAFLFESHIVRCKRKTI